ncbi:hypothetical protein J1N35_005700 [Gossypium stocksii]|uniref:Uncharacterized protein n=1 Tax=Gossypium stocksii TaxID=47602 RepID=A0A9D4AJI0_9ROSI|nr:hypothetical protein J1N35_005700 [Gossypium stocksii]
MTCARTLRVERVHRSRIRVYPVSESAKFPQIFQKYNLEFKPDIVGLFETHVSGVKTDKIIAKLGFQYSHRLEAMGFSGEIWIGWRESIRIEIVHNHSQFVLTRVSGCVPTQFLTLHLFTAVLSAKRNENGEWLFEEAELQLKAIIFFKKLYGEQSVGMKNLSISNFPRLDHSDFLLLGKEVLVDEIKITLFKMSPMKSSGSDGFHALFFQSQWELVAGAVCK